MYSVEVLTKVRKMLKEKENFEKISAETGVPEKTIKKWSKFPKTISDMIGKEKRSLVTLAKQERESLNLQMKLAIQEGRIEDVKKIALAHPNCAELQLELIIIYIQEGKTQEAEDIATAEQFKKNVPIQSKLIKILCLEGKIDEAIEIAKRFPNSITIQSMLIRIYVRENRIDEAREVARRFPKNETIQNQLHLLTAKGKELTNQDSLLEEDLEDLLRIDSDNLFEIEPDLDSQAIPLKTKCSEQILGQILDGTLEDEEIKKIKESDSEDIKDIILKFAYMEKNDLSQTMRRKILEYRSEHPEYNIILTTLLNRIQIKSPNKDRLAQKSFFEKILLEAKPRDIKEMDEERV